MSSIQNSLFAKLFITFLIGNFTSFFFFNSRPVQGFYERRDSDSNSEGFSKLQKWSQSIPALKLEDAKRTERLMSREAKTLAEVRDHYYQIANMPLQSVCTVGKFFGGKWMSQCGAFDGHKYICLDQFYRDVEDGTCLIYSFGVAGDWSFEEAMAHLGCKIRAFDPTIDGKQKPASDLITFQRTGLADKTGYVEGLGPVLTLKDAIDSMGDTGKVISYLKVDIEGSEIKAIPEWIRSGMMEHVRQLGIEIHTGILYMGHNPLPDLSDLLESFRKLHQIGFRLISNANNDCIDKSDDLERRYMSYMEVVLYKPES